LEIQSKDTTTSVVPSNKTRATGADWLRCRGEKGGGGRRWGVKFACVWETLLALIITIKTPIK